MSSKYVSPKLTFDSPWWWVDLVDDRGDVVYRMTPGSAEAFASRVQRLAIEALVIEKRPK